MSEVQGCDRVPGEVPDQGIHLREADLSSIAAVLAEIKLSSGDIKNRIAELEILTEKSSDDMASWGYDDAQREIHMQVLSQLSVAYTAYEALAQNQNSQNSKPDSLARLFNSSAKFSVNPGAIENTGKKFFSFNKFANIYLAIWRS